MPRCPLAAPGLAIAFALACSSPAQDGEEGADAARACREFAEVLCARRWECIPLAFARGNGFGDAFGTEEACVARTVLACEGWRHLPGTRTTPSALGACAVRLAELDCRTSTHTLTYPAGKCELERGSLPEGTRCETHMQCDSQACRSENGAYRCAARLEPPVDPALGEACAEHGCGDDLACVDQVCAPPALIGEACGGAGPPCASYAELGCDAAGTCAPHGTSESACGLQIRDGTFTACSSGECVVRSDLGFGSCVPYLGDGEACEPYSGAVCLYPAQCRDGRCRVPGIQ